jgi:hypothetical protein
LTLFWFIALVSLAGAALFLIFYLFLVRKYYWGPTGKPPSRKPREKDPT